MRARDLLRPVLPGFAGMALLAGCAPPPPTACDVSAQLNAAAATEPAPAPMDSRPLGSVGRRGVRMTDSSLGALVLVDDVQTGRTVTGSVRVAIRLLNCSALPLQVEGLTQFVDPSGAQAEPPTAWRRLFLPPGTSRVYEEASATPQPASLWVELRGGR